MALPTWADVLGAIPGALEKMWEFFDGLVLKAQADAEWLKQQAPDAAPAIDAWLAKRLAEIDQWKADASANLNGTVAEAALAEMKEQLMHLWATHQSPAPPDVGDLA